MGKGKGSSKKSRSFNFETRTGFDIFERDDDNQLRTRDHRTFEGAIENFEARFFDSVDELDLDNPVLITNAFAMPGDIISQGGSNVPFTLELTTRLVEDPADGFTLAEEILPFEVKEEPLANLVGGDPINEDVSRRLEYIINGDELSSLDSQILEVALIIEDADGDSHNGFQIFQDGEFVTIIDEEDVTGDNPRALNDINFIIDNNLLGFSESNEENTEDDDEGIVDRLRITRVIEDGGSKHSSDNSHYDPYPEYYDPHHKFEIRSVEKEVNFQNSFDRFGGDPDQEQFVIEAEDLNLHTYRVEPIDIARGGKVISLLGANGHTGTAELDVDEFGIEPGTYGLILSAFDENDGQGRLEVFVNDDRVADIKLDLDLDGDFAIEETRRNISIGDIEIDSGDIITVQGTADEGEFARVDFLSFSEVDV